MIIKICGITSVEDALLALEEGANALGFNFWPSSARYLPPPEADEIIARARRYFDRGSFLTVGILVGAEGWQDAPTDVLQFHGLTDLGSVPETGRRTWVAVNLETADRFPSSEIVIDGSWGQGEVADWDGLSRLRRPFILAGGLTPDNVGKAIRHLHPAGVDVCSGVEKCPGRKDPGKLKQFLREVKHATPRIMPRINAEMPRISADKSMPRIGAEKPRISAEE
ncbi:MAG: N-(5'-phosphoribosyl)anthranilate isomerase [Acidobacteriota bacterium]